MNKKILAVDLMFVCGFAVAIPAMAMTLSGPITASSVVVSGDVTFSSMTASSATVANQLNVTGFSLGIPGRIVQIKFSSSTFTTSVTTTTWTAVSNIAKSITPLKASDYMRISLTGNLTNASTILGAPYPAYITVFRDSTNLGDNNLGLSDTQSGSSPLSQWIDPVGITIKDSPGDTNVHTYQAYIRGVNVGSANFPQYSIGYLLIEEVSQQ